MSVPPKLAWLAKSSAHPRSSPGTTLAALPAPQPVDDSSSSTQPPFRNTTMATALKDYIITRTVPGVDKASPEGLEEMREEQPGARCLRRPPTLACSAHPPNRKRFLGRSCHSQVLAEMDAEHPGSIVWVRSVVSEDTVTCFYKVCALRLRHEEGRLHRNRDDCSTQGVCVLGWGGGSGGPVLVAICRAIGLMGRCLPTCQHLPSHTHPFAMHARWCAHAHTRKCARARAPSCRQSPHTHRPPSTTCAHRGRAPLPLTPQAQSADLVKEHARRAPFPCDHVAEVRNTLTPNTIGAPFF